MNLEMNIQGEVREMSIPAVTQNSQMQQAAYTVSLKSVHPKNEMDATAANKNTMAPTAPKTDAMDTVTISSKAREMATTQGTKT
jgi:hypothetical protein